MIKQENFIKSIEIIHRLLIHLKIMNVNNKSHTEMYNFIDELEYLLLLMLEEEDKTELFEYHLNKICKENKVLFVWEKYKNII